MIPLIILLSYLSAAVLAESNMLHNESIDEARDSNGNPSHPQGSGLESRGAQTISSRNARQRNVNEKAITVSQSIVNPSLSVDIGGRETEDYAKSLLARPSLLETPYVSPADVYAAYCERVDERRPWTPPPPLKGNTGR